MHLRSDASSACGTLLRYTFYTIFSLSFLFRATLKFMSRKSAINSMQQCWMSKKKHWRSILEQNIYFIIISVDPLNISAYASNNSNSCRRQIVNIIQIANRYVGRLLIRLETRDCIICFNSIDCMDANLDQTP